MTWVCKTPFNCNLIAPFKTISQDHGLSYQTRKVIPQTAICIPSFQTVILFVSRKKTVAIYCRNFNERKNYRQINQPPFPFFPNDVHKAMAHIKFIATVPHHPYLLSLGKKSSFLAKKQAGLYNSKEVVRCKKMLHGFGSRQHINSSKKLSKQKKNPPFFCFMFVPAWDTFANKDNVKKIILFPD